MIICFSHRNRFTMKNSIVSVAILFIIILACPVSISKTINVPDDSRNIQSAIDMAEPGDTIIVAPGTYKENIEIQKGITLKGSGVDATNLLGAVIVKNADGVVIEGFTLDGQSHKDSHRGIWCSFSTMTIANNAVVRYHHGITTESSRIIIENNSILENLNAGIEIKTAIMALIKGVTVSRNIDTGIVVALSEDKVLITDSVISGNRVGIDCVRCAPEIRRNIIKGNKIGVQSSPGAEPDLGTDDTPGLNVIENNDVHIANMERRHAVQARNNYWGSHKGPDASGFDGKVDYTPWLETDPLRVQPVEQRRDLITTWGILKAS